MLRLDNATRAMTSPGAGDTDDVFCTSLCGRLSREDGTSRKWSRHALRHCAPSTRPPGSLGDLIERGKPCLPGASCARTLRAAARGLERDNPSCMRSQEDQKATFLRRTRWWNCSLFRQNAWRAFAVRSRRHFRQAALRETSCW